MKRKVLQTVAIWFFLSIGLLFCGEALLRQDFLGFFRWIKNYPLHFMFNLVMIFSLLALLSCFFNHIGIGFSILSVVYITACIVSFYKFRISGEYLIPADLILAGEAASISKEMNITLEHNVVICTIISLLGILGAFKLNIFNIKTKYRLISGIVFGVVFFTVGGIGAKVCTLEQQELQMPPSATVNEQYHENGFLIGFTQELSELVIQRPENYSKQKVQQLLEPYTNQGQQVNFEKPNIIMIMSESFSDLESVSGITLSEDPLKYFKGLQENYVGGTLITPVYGGRTCQTEYEVLTGQSVLFTGASNIAYMRLVDETTPSMAKLLKQEGYRTIALHGYEKQFFSRNIAYENLGIDRFLASEDFENPDLARGYISDKQLMERVIELYEEQPEEPLMMHVVTMQNHMPYSDTYEENGITAEAPRLTDEENSMVATYANGLKDSNEALELLINYFSQVKRPTIIVMYGDHRPALGDQYDVYKDAGFVSEPFDKNDFFKLYQTPYVVWNNYGLPKENWGYMDATYLGSSVLSYAGYTADPYMNYLQSSKAVIKAFSPYFVIDEKGQVKDENNLTPKEEQTLKDLWTLQYNRLNKN